MIKKAEGLNTEKFRIKDMSRMGFWMVGPIAILLTLHGNVSDMTLYPEQWDVSWFWARMGVIPVSALAMYILKSRWREKYSDWAVVLLGFYITTMLCYIISHTGYVESVMWNAIVQLLVGTAIIPIKPKSYLLSVVNTAALYLWTIFVLAPGGQSDSSFATLLTIEPHLILALAVYYVVHKTRQVSYRVQATLEKEIEQRQATIDDLVSKTMHAKEAELKFSLSQQVAHDIRSPLTALRAILRGKDLSYQPIQELLRDTIVRLDSISSDLLQQSSFFKLKETALRPNADLKTVFEKLIQQKHLEFGVDERKIIFNCTAQDSINEFEPVQIQRVLSNLINNSYEAIDPQSGIIWIELGKQNSEIYFTVSDNGSGISSADHGRLGEQGFTTKLRHERSGHGLGLFFAKSVIDQRGGQIKIQARPEGGTVIIATWPEAVVALEA